MTRNAGALFPPPLNPVASTEHEWRDPHLPAVPHTEKAEEEGGRVVLGLPELANVYSSHHDDPSGATESQDAAAEAANPSSQRQDPGEGMSTPPGQPLSKWHGKGKYVPAVWSHHQRQGQNHGNQQVHTAELGVQRGEASFQPDGGGTRGAGSGAGRGRRSQEVAGRGPCGGTSSPEESDRSSIPGETGNGGDGTDEDTVGSESGANRSVKIGQKNVWWAASKGQGPCGKNCARPSTRKKDYRTARTSQCNASIFVRLPRRKCRQFCSTLLPTCEEEPSYNTHVFWWQLLINEKIPHLCLQILHAAKFHFFRGAYILLRELADTKSQEAQGLLEEIRRPSSVSVLSGPAIVITNIATVSAFLADGWSTESVSRVVRTARTRQENNERERADHAYYSHTHDEVTISDIFPATVQVLDGGEHPAENTTPEDDQEDETEQSLSDSLQTRRHISSIHENMGHPSNRTLVRVLRLGGAKRRFILTAAKHSCGACEAQ